MKFLILDSKDPYRNLAIEEYLFSHTEDDVFMLWQNEPTVVIGKNQNPYVELDLAMAEAKGIHIARRITGGGAVYHDLGNVNYSYLSTKGEGDGIDFAPFTAPILAALGALGIQATLSGRNDLLVGEQKFSGNAQHRSGDRVLHHGTLLFDSDLTVLDQILQVDEEKLRARAIRSARARVTNLKPLLPVPCDTAAFITLLASFVQATYHTETIPCPEDPEIDALTARNASREWLFPDRALLSGYERRVKRRYPFGTVEISLDMMGDTIRRAAIRGDFFGTASVADLENALAGLPLSQVSQRLATLDVGAYVFGMDHEMLSALLLQDALGETFLRGCPRGQ